MRSNLIRRRRYVHFGIRK